MFMLLCPEGAEGTSYAMLTTLNNVANAAAGNIGTSPPPPPLPEPLLPPCLAGSLTSSSWDCMSSSGTLMTQIWDVSNESLASGDFGVRLTQP